MITLAFWICGYCLTMHQAAGLPPLNVLEFAALTIINAILTAFALFTLVASTLPPR